MLKDHGEHIVLAWLVVLLYSLPVPDYSVAGLGWIDIATRSTVFAAVCLKILPVRVSPVLIGCELVGQLTLFLSYTQHILALKSQWFYAHFEDIMTTCTAFEVIALIMGVIGLDTLGRILRVLRTTLFGHEPNHSVFYAREKCI